MLRAGDAAGEPVEVGCTRYGCSRTIATTGNAMPARTARRPQPLATRYRCSSIEQPGSGEAAEHGERRQHEHEMADAVVHRRPQRDRDRHRQRRGEHDDEIDGAARRRDVASAGGGDERRRLPPNASSQNISGSFSANSVGT